MIKLCHVAFFFVEYLYFCIDYAARHQMCAVSGIFRSCHGCLPACCAGHLRDISFNMYNINKEKYGFFCLFQLC